MIEIPKLGETNWGAGFAASIDAAFDFMALEIDRLKEQVWAMNLPPVCDDILPSR